jgi:hypothetical protein
MIIKTLKESKCLRFKQVGKECSQHNLRKMKYKMTKGKRISSYCIDGITLDRKDMSTKRRWRL